MKKSTPNAWLDTIESDTDEIEINKFSNEIEQIIKNFDDLQLLQPNKVIPSEQLFAKIGFPSWTEDYWFKIACFRKTLHEKRGFYIDLNEDFSIRIVGEKETQKYITERNIKEYDHICGCIDRAVSTEWDRLDMDKIRDLKKSIRTSLQIEEMTLNLLNQSDK